jgi:hypothetical protein
MKFAVAFLLAFALSAPLAFAADAAPSTPATESEPSPRVQSHDIPEDDDEEDDTPWALYGVVAGFTLFAAVVFLVISRADRSGKG